jgi:hypothetical protein
MSNICDINKGSKEYELDQGNTDNIHNCINETIRYKIDGLNGLNDSNETLNKNTKSLYKNNVYYVYLKVIIFIILLYFYYIFIYKNNSKK